PRPGRSRAARPPQPGARGVVADVLRHLAGGHEAARGASQGAAVRGARLDDEAPSLGPGPTLARGHRTGRPGAAADDPHPRVPGTAAGSDRAARHARTRHPVSRRGPRRGVGSRTVLIAPDSFKGSLTSVSVATALADGWARARLGD